MMFFWSHHSLVSIIVILAVIFFISGLLTLLVRFVMKHTSSSSSSSLSSLSNRSPEIPNSGSFQRLHLQHLFQLHDSGLDQALIDCLPVFCYKDIMGSEQPFDCAVCLCEFSDHDRLRLLPFCTHAFHIDCIDTWLLSSTTCPLCRGNLLTPDGVCIGAQNPGFCLDGSREGDGVFSASENDSTAPSVAGEKRVFSVRLGKFRGTSGTNNIENQDVELGETSDEGNLGSRRCYSMGYYQYVVSDSDLQVGLSDGLDGGGQNGNFTGEDDGGEKIKMRSYKGESFSVSKIWMWSKKDKFPTYGYGDNHFLGHSGW
ncbi:PREDICTED: RING-H2 finger protein ATL47-like [Ipomoea nil]|uniref:RING-H2 finger protein ATL47-like n=1 Tax=Ipomoea nil TaxID=35883 RepID=UPI000901D856|nr:PREDICTED: RING-H2 finger protein ATL47-like [Ipomoea nil]